MKLVYHFLSFLLVLTFLIFSVGFRSAARPHLPSDRSSALASAIPLSRSTPSEASSLTEILPEKVRKVLASTSLFSSVVEEGLKRIPFEETEKMNSFFDYAIKVCHAGYVLYFDSKPVSLINFWAEDNSTAKFRDGWDVYKKYEHFFPHKNYIFDEQKNDFF